MLTDETCWFLAIDFDKESWSNDVTAFMETYRSLKIPAVLERSRSGKGAHVWIFFLHLYWLQRRADLILTGGACHTPERGLACTAKMVKYFTFHFYFIRFTRKEL
ncbi:MAG: hypothetical protein E3K36_11095 [Candidatus Brocadia sp.]|nr:hypothetical protein [Candidatus Brocadia sp.]